MTDETKKIWLTFIINKILVYSGVFLASYGITVSGNTAELIAGGILMAIQFWNSHRNVKNALKAAPPEIYVDPTKPRMVTPLILLLIPVMAFSGCAWFAPNYSALPKDATTEQKKAAALADTKRSAASKEVRFAARIILTEGGKAALSQVKESVDREAIKTQLRSWGNAVKAKLQKGDVTVDQVEGIFSTFDSKLDAQKFSDKFNEITVNFKDYFEELKAVDSAEILRQWIVMFADVAISIGS